MAIENIHTTYNKATGNWRNVREGTSISSKVYETKSQAQAEGQRIELNNESEHLIHNHNEKISQRNSYGKDDFPPRG